MSSEVSPDDNLCLKHNPASGIKHGSRDDWVTKHIVNVQIGLLKRTEQRFEPEVKISGLIKQIKGSRHGQSMSSNG